MPELKPSPVLAAGEESSYYTKSFSKIVHAVMSQVFHMIIVIFYFHPFDKLMRKWYSYIGISCKEFILLRNSMHRYSLFHKGEM